EIAVGLDILATRQRDVPERQRSLRAVFDHTWQLLTEGEQRAMCQLSLFRGGFGREAGEEIAAATLPLLSALVSKSLIRRTAKGRYDLHELIRQYAVEHLQGKPQLQAVTRDRYAAFYLALAEEADSHLRGAQQLHWLELLEQEHDNVRAVLEWALTGDGTAADSHVEEALQLAVALRWFWYIRGHFHEGRDWLTKLLQRCPSRRAVVCARALEGAGLLTNALGEHGAAVQLAEESIALFREMDDLRGLASGLTLKGAALRWQGFVSEGNGCLGEALAVHRDVGDRWGVALNLWELGRYLADFGGDENGEAMLEESARILEELGDRYTLAAVLVSLGVVAIGHAEYAMARTHLERSLTMCREIGDPWHTADALSNLGYVLRLQGDFDPARNSLEEALRVYQEGGSRVWELDPLCALAENDILQGNLADADWRLTKVRARPEIEGNTWLQVLAGYLQGILSYYQGDTERAAALLMEAKTMAEEGQYKPDIARLLISLGRVMITRHAQREAAVLLHEGLELFIKLGHKLGVVSALEGMAELPAEDATGAVRMLATAEATRKAIGAPLPPVEHPARAALLTEIRARLSEEAFARAWAEGTAMSLEETATNALAGKWPV
ncbi:MAG TPA: tetratricopeptide repeat protein, partial [Candidatus Binatia bacterium]|nr:tetratricopeptide repeat protein [Candidatus Binatia bacterium]